MKKQGMVRSIPVVNPKEGMQVIFNNKVHTIIGFQSETRVLTKPTIGGGVFYIRTKATGSGI